MRKGQKLRTDGSKGSLAVRGKLQLFLFLLLLWAGCVPQFPGDRKTFQTLMLCLASRSGICVPEYPFNPANVSAMQFWLAADDVVPSTGTVVSRWPDRSANANHVVQSTAAMQPTYTTGAAPYFHPVVYFDGGDQLTGLNTALTGADFTFFVVYNRPVAGGHPFLEVGQVTLTNAKSLGVNGSLGVDVCSRNVACAPGPAGVTYTNNTWHAVTVTYSGSGNQKQTQWRDGASVGSGTAQALAFDTVGFASVGNAPNGGAGFVGYIAEIIYYNRILSSSEIDYVNCYMTLKFAIGSALFCK